MGTLEREELLDQLVPSDMDLLLLDLWAQQEVLALKGALVLQDQLVQKEIQVVKDHKVKI